MTIVLDGTTGITGVNGTAAAPAITGTDTDTGVVYGTNTLSLVTGGTERAVVDSSGNVGIGTSSPGAKLDVAGGNIKTDSVSRQIGYWEADAVHDGYFIPYNASGMSELVNSFTSGALVFKTGTSKTERMRIDSSGNLLVGQTAQSGSEAFGITRAANTATYIHMIKTGQVECTWGLKSSTDTNMYIGTGSASVGTTGVYLTNTGSSWNAVSDERTKTIVEPIENAAQKVAGLRSVIGYYNHDEKQIRRPFLIAQDVQAVLPEAVSIADQETGTLGLAYTDTIPLLVAAIKEQQATITALTARVVALEGVQA